MLLIVPLVLLLVMVFIPKVHVMTKAVLHFDPIPYIAGIFALLAIATGAYIGAGLLVAGTGVYLYRNRPSAALSGPEKPPEIEGGE